MECDERCKGYGRFLVNWWSDFVEVVGRMIVGCDEM